MSKVRKFTFAEGYVLDWRRERYPVVVYDGATYSRGSQALPVRFVEELEADAYRYIQRRLDGFRNRMGITRAWTPEEIKEGLVRCGWRRIFGTDCTMLCASMVVGSDCDCGGDPDHSASEDIPF